MRGAEILANVTRQDELNRDGRTTACRLLRRRSGRVEPSIFEASSSRHTSATRRRAQSHQTACNSTQ